MNSSISKASVPAAKPKCQTRGGTINVPPGHTSTRSPVKGSRARKLPRKTWIAFQPSETGQQLSDMANDCPAAKVEWQR
jgi:hypothetical protein